MKEIQKNRRCLQRSGKGSIFSLISKIGGGEEEDVAAEKLDGGQNCRFLRERDTCRFKKLLLQTRGDSRSNHRLRTRASCNFIWAYLLIITQYQIVLPIGPVSNETMLTKKKLKSLSGTFICTSLSPRPGPFHRKSQRPKCY
ncbi:hypothetical protein YC2023_067616 [Brassica napus]